MSLDKCLKEMKDSFRDIWTNELVLEATNASIAATNVPEGCSVLPQGIATLGKGKCFKILNTLLLKHENNNYTIYAWRHYFFRKFLRSYKAYIRNFAWRGRKECLDLLIH